MTKPGAKLAGFGAQIASSLGAQVLRVTTTLVLTAILLRRLGAAEIGTFFLAQSGAVVGSRLAVYGLNRSVVAASAEGVAEYVLRPLARQVIRANLIRRVLPVVVLVALFLMMLTRDGLRIFVLAGLVVIWSYAAALGVVSAEIARAHNGLLWPAALQGIGGGVAAGVLGIVLVVAWTQFLEAGALVVVGLLTVATAVPAVFYQLVRRPSVDSAEVTTAWLTERGLEAGRAQLATIVGSDVDLWIAGLLLGPAVAATYGLAKKIAMQFGLLPHVVATAAVPRVLAAINNPELKVVTEQRLTRTSRQLVSLSALGLAFVFVFLDSALERIGSNVMTSVGVTVAVLALPPLALAALGSPGYFLQALPESRSSRVATVSGVLASVVALPVLAISLDVYGLAAGYAAIWIVVALFEFRALRTAQDFDPSTFGGRRPQ